MTLPPLGPKKLDPANYPRVYTVQTGYLVISYVGAVAIAAVGVAVSWVLAAGSVGPALALAVAVAPAALLLGTYVAIDARKSKIILTVDAIEVHDLWLRAPKRIERADIADVHTARANKGPDYLVLVPREGRGKTVSYAQGYETDSAFADWMDGLPDLARAERERSEESIVSDATLGPSRDARLTRLTAAHDQATWVMGAAIVACAWGLLYPRPYFVVYVVLAAMPWLAILVAWRSDGLWRLAQFKNDAHANVALPLMLPGFVLTLRAGVDLNLLHWQEVAAPAAAIAAVLLVAALRADPSLSHPYIDPALWMLLVALAYGFGSVSLADRLFDGSSRERYRAQVEDTRVHRGTKGGTSYSVVIGPWGPHDGTSQLHVTREFHDSVRFGDTVCVVMGQGAIGVRWYDVEHCER